MSVLSAMTKPHCAALMAILSVSILGSRAGAQTVIERSTSTTEVTVTGRVTTSTETVVRSSPPVVVDPATVVEPAPARSMGVGLGPTLTLRAELTLSGAFSMPLAGMCARFGLEGADGWGGGLVAGYFGEIGTSTPSELQLGLEAWRDFGPGGSVAFQLLGRAGTALVLEPVGPSPRVLAQLGIGARVSMDPGIAVLFDARGELRARPAPVSSEGHASGPELAGGFTLTLGLAIRLD